MDELRMTPEPIKPINIWTLKPWWCQPWSIVLTTIGIPAASWLLFHRLWLTGLVGLPLLIWMGFFLWVYPPLMQQALNQQEIK